MLPSHLIQVRHLPLCAVRQETPVAADTAEWQALCFILKEMKLQGSACNGQSRSCCQGPQACWLRLGSADLQGSTCPWRASAGGPLGEPDKLTATLLTAGPGSKAAQAGPGCLAAAGCPGGLPDRCASPAGHQLQGSGGAVQVKRVHTDTGSSRCEHVATPADTPVHSAMHSCDPVLSHPDQGAAQSGQGQVTCSRTPQASPHDRCSTSAWGTSQCFASFTVAMPAEALAMRQCQQSRCSMLHWEHCCSLGRPGLPLRSTVKPSVALRFSRPGVAGGCQPSLPRWTQTSDWLPTAWRRSSLAT